MFKTIAARLREPSTFAGLSALALLFGVPIGTADAIAQAVAAIAAVVAVVLPEKVRTE